MKKNKDRPFVLVLLVFLLSIFALFEILSAFLLLLASSIENNILLLFMVAFIFAILDAVAAYGIWDFKKYGVYLALISAILGSIVIVGCWNFFDIYTNIFSLLSNLLVIIFSKLSWKYLQ